MMEWVRIINNVITRTNEIIVNESVLNSRIPEEKMKSLKFNLDDYEELKNHMKAEEKSTATIEKYIRDIRKFLTFAEGKELDKSLAIEYKNQLAATYSVVSANSMIAAVNYFFRYLGIKEYCVKQFRIQRQIYCDKEKELTKSEYIRLVKTAKAKNDRRLELLLQTICSTGIRVSELRFITREAVECGQAVVTCKKKTRVVFIPFKLRTHLKKYCKQTDIITGPVFITRTGKAMDRCNIWRKMKALCSAAGIDSSKVFPHNLRHLFAKVFYDNEKDIAKLADMLGHSDLNTTRIYIMETGYEHRRKLENLRLVL